MEKNNNKNRYGTGRQGKRGYGRDRAENRETQPIPDENVIFGRNAVRELLESGRDVDKLFISSGEREGSVNLILGIASERGIPIFERDRAKLDELTHGAKHQGVVAIASEANYSTVDEILAYAESKGEPPFIVMCDGIEDPHNLGAIIRTAECCGVHGVIIPKRRAVGLTSTVAKSSAGALMHMRVAKVTNLAVTLDELKERGIWAYAADMDGTECRKTDMKGASVIVMGSEGFGISRLVKEKCDFVVSIKMYGQVNSMNVSCAAAVILTEVARQRNEEG